MCCTANAASVSLGEGVLTVIGERSDGRLGVVERIIGVATVMEAPVPSFVKISLVVLSLSGFSVNPMLSPVECSSNEMVLLDAMVGKGGSGEVGEKRRGEIGE